MMSLVALIKAMTVLVTVSGLTVGVEDEMGVTRYYAAVEKKMPEVKQTSSVKITINGEDLLDELEAELKLLKRADVDLSKELNRLVITSDAMDDELAKLLEKARVLMNERTGRIEIVHEHGGEHLAQAVMQMRKTHAPGELLEHFRVSPPAVTVDGRTVVSGMGGMGGGMGGMRGMRGGPRGGMGGFGGGGGAFSFDPLISARYAYAEKDRQRAVELEGQSRDLARQYSTSDDETIRAEAASKLRANLNELFDLKLNGYTEKMSSIESGLERLRQRIEERKKNKELIVTGRFKELVGEDNHLRW